MDRDRAIKNKEAGFAVFSSLFLGTTKNANKRGWFRE